MSTEPRGQTTDGTPTYLGSPDPAGKFSDYYPAWVDNLADDVTLEGSLQDGAVQGADAVRTIVVGIRALYEHQVFNFFTGPWGDDRFIEDYTAHVGGQPIGCVVMGTMNASGQAQHIAANYLPRSSLLPMSRLLRAKFAGTPYAKYYLSES
jgi:hypothetical protein